MRLDRRGHAHYSGTAEQESLVTYIFSKLLFSQVGTREPNKNKLAVCERASACVWATLGKCKGNNVKKHIHDPKCGFICTYIGNGCGGLLWKLR